MKIIPIGLQCTVPEAIKRANMREYSYPLDWLWSPSKTTYHLFSILIKESLEKAIDYMTTGYSYYKYMNNEHYESVDHNTESQMNKNTGLGITHYTINEEFKGKLKRRLERLLMDINSGEDLLLIYADSANPYLNYHLDDMEFGVDATEYLLKIHELLFPLNNKIHIVYFCWNERKRPNSHIEYISYDFKENWVELSEIIKEYLLSLKASL